ncbi:hypothetical protein DXG01_007291 [Tephrocybe rancida]|nr:hypothetical protein DXG01_007291 [Tephrocybe rancida]
MGSCLSRGRRSSSEQEPLLPKVTPPPPPPTHSTLDKFIDVLAGRQSGKLPSQDQLAAILRSALSSSILKGDPQILSGPCSKDGKRVLVDVREVLEAMLQFGMEKNMDNKLQELVYGISQIEGPPMHVNADTAFKAGQEGLTQAQAEAPTQTELMHDTTTFFTSLKAVARLLVTSAAFRLLLSDIFSSARSALAQLASEVGNVAQEVQIAAEGIEKAANMEGGTLSTLPVKFEEAVEGIRGGVQIEEAKRQTHTEKTTKDAFVARVQDLIVRAHQDPRSLQALQALLEISHKYARKLTHSAKILSDASATSSISVVPTSESSQALDDLKALLERLASGYSLDNLLRSLADTIERLMENIRNSGSTETDADLNQYFTSVDDWLSKALAPEQPLYATSRRGTRALENIYDGGHILFLSSSGSSPASSWTESLRQVLDAYDSYATAFSTDRSTTRLLSAFSTLHGDLSNLAALSPGLGTHVKAQKDGLLRDFLGWVLPRIIKAVGKVGIPMPRVEYTSGKIAGALDALKMGPGQAGGVVLDVVPDQVVVRTCNEVRVDMREDLEGATGSGASTSSSSRMQVHVDGVRLTVRELGYFFSYGSGLLGYSDQGLLSLEIGCPEAARLERVSQGLSLDVDLSLETGPSNIGSAPTTPPPLFDVLDVRTALPGVRFQLDKSKHWILNKLFVQPLAGPIVSRVAAGVLETRIRAMLEGISTGLAVVMHAARNSQNRGTNRVGFLDYWEALLDKGPEAFGLTPSVDDDDEGSSSENVERRSKTTVNLEGIVHTTGAVASGSSSREPEETETAVAIGNGAMLFPDKAGAYEAEDGDAGVVEMVTHEVESAVDQAGAAMESTAESAAELRGGIERAEERRVEGKRVESSRDGWRSHVFDLH